jgi:hypothetical protein
MAILHLFTGDAPAETVRASLRIPQGEALIQHDVISVGPMPAFASRDEWLRTRDDFWEGVGGAPEIEEFPHDLVVEAERLQSATRLVLWVGAGLSDRLLLPSVLALADIMRMDLPPIETVEITSHASLRVPVLGWGMLRPADIGNPARAPLSMDGRIRARRAWAALTATSPASYLHALETVEEDDALLAALSTLIERYPDAVRGLSHWDSALLASIPDSGADVFNVIGGAIGANHQHLDPVGDLYLFWRLRRLADSALPQPLLTLSGDLGQMRHCTVTPTPFGRRVRDGTTSHVAVNGIDDWIGGVHLRSPAGSPWYRRNGELIPDNTP